MTAKREECNSLQTALRAAHTFHTTIISSALIRNSQAEQRKIYRGKLALRKCLNATHMAKNLYKKTYVFNRILNNWVQDTLRPDLLFLCLFE